MEFASQSLGLIHNAESIEWTQVNLSVFSDTNCTNWHERPRLLNAEGG
jgi:hypothetical protein